MRTIRIHVDALLRAGDDIVLPPQAAAHVVRVLRLKAGDPITLFNGDGYDHPAKLTGAVPRRLHARVVSRSPGVVESSLRITLVQSIARCEKMDWIVQKATELGAVAIVPLLTERSEVRLDAMRAKKRLEHWRGVAIAACEQSGRNVLLLIGGPATLEAWLGTLDAHHDETRLTLHTGEGISPRGLQPTPHNILLTVGPEGGFSERDLAALRDTGFCGLTLGPRILRTETAGVAAIAALQALYGDL